MTFDSVTFWLFFPIAWLGWRFLPFGAAKSFALLASLIFYGWWNPLYLPLILFSGFVDYRIGGRMQSEERAVVRRLLVALSLTLNLGLLGFFKYAPFATRTARDLLGYEPVPNAFADWVVPIGISFYTFQTLSYTIDIYRRTVRPAKSLRDFLLYVSFFPQLVAGPIVRASQLLPQLEQRQKLRMPRIQVGLYRCIQGLFLKIVIADSLAPMVGRVFDGEIASLSPSAAWLGVLGFGIQIFADFAGYSWIAIGLACLLGLRFPENFRYPYISRSLSEFWTRWHITLSSWLRDYLYIPLGGNRRGRLRTYINLMLTMLLGGLWHGASWNFVIWGGLHGLGLCVMRLFERPAFRPGSRGGALYSPRMEELLRVMRPLASMFAVFFFVHLTWVFFRAADLKDAMLLLERMLLGPFQGAELGGSHAGVPQEWRYLVFFLPVAVMHFGQWAFERRWLKNSAWLRAISAAIMLVALFCIRRGEGREFIYFQF